MKARQKLIVLSRAAVALTSLAVADVCHAAPPPPLDQGYALHKKGNIAVEADRIEEAIIAWREAWKHRPNTPVLACNIGRAEYRLARYREATTWLTRCVQINPKTTNPEEIETNKQIALERVAARQQVAAVTIRTEEPVLRIVVDDDTIRDAPFTEDLFLDPGEHHIQAYNGLRTIWTKLSTQKGKEYNVDLALPSVPSRSLVARAEPQAPAFKAGKVPWVDYTIPEPLPTFRWWPIAVGGALAGTGVVVGTVLVGISSGKSGDADFTLTQIQSEGKNCDTTPIDPRCATADRFESSSTTFSTAAIATFIASGAIAAGAIGYAIYENHRITVAASVAGIRGSYEW